MDSSSRFTSRRNGSNPEISSATHDQFTAYFMRVAIVHYWLLNRRGGEAVLEALCRLLPDADLFTLFYDPERVSPAIRARRITASFLNPLRRHYRALLPLMPMALEHFDLRGYDLVIRMNQNRITELLRGANGSALILHTWP